MKKFIALLLAALMVLSLVACASKTETAEEPAACEADFEDAEPKAEEAAEETCGCTETPCCCEAPAEEAPAETPEIKIEVVDDENKAE